MSRTPKVIRYIANDSEYRATFNGPINDQKTTLKWRWVNAWADERGPWCGEMKLLDHGNGVRIEGENISIDLDYSQLSDLYHLMDAHNRGNDGWMWERYEVTVKEVKPRQKKEVSKKKATKKVDKKAKKK